MFSFPKHFFFIYSSNYDIKLFLGCLYTYFFSLSLMDLRCYFFAFFYRVQFFYDFIFSDILPRYNLPKSFRFLHASRPYKVNMSFPAAPILSKTNLQQFYYEVFNHELEETRRITATFSILEFAFSFIANKLLNRYSFSELIQKV